MSETATQTRAFRRVEELCSAALRALAADPSLAFRRHRPYAGDRPLPDGAPHTRLTGNDTLVTARGAGDAQAQRLRFSDSAIHRALAPDDPVRLLVFEALEQFRVEARTPAHLPGVRRNLRLRHEAWSVAFANSGLLETSRGILLYTVFQICRARVTGDPIVSEVEDGLEATRFGIVPLMGSALARLRELTHDQAAYAHQALTIADRVAELIVQADDEPDADGTGAPGRDDLRLVIETDPDATPGVPLVGSPTHAGNEPASEPDYRVFTHDYDRVDAADRLFRAAALRDLRVSLDGLVADQAINVPRLAQRLQERLARPLDWGLRDGDDEGRIDPSRLTRLITAPHDRHLFRQPVPRAVLSCRVTFLVDCSGSMRQHLDALAPLLDVFARALDLATVPTEVLGFTTRTWNGGRARRDWNRAGRPPMPGRLNEVQHLVFKPAESTYRQSRPSLSALLRHDLFREGIDGEAVVWALGRHSPTPDERHIVVVVSDGSPMDSATHLTNGEDYLDRHLAEVVRRADATPGISVRGLGVGLDLSPYYAHSRALDLATLPPAHLVRELESLITEP